MPNRLAGETSPYLLQHAHNPVDWYPWGPEALERAKAEDRPIFLSIGYSACHWCHVMEHESFEQADIARRMNESFINIKVDREERSDLDQIYMNAVQLMTGRGGWPMSMFLTPDLEPFFGGTYWPPTARHGMPGFDQVLSAVAEAWKNRRLELASQASQLAQRLREIGRLEEAAGQLPDDLLETAGRTLERMFDSRYGGFGQAPKFPHPMDLRLLLRLWRRKPRERALEMVTCTLDKMAAGGIYDQLGGGFHRYAVDERWLVPHFEKMLYDNALLAVAYLEAYQATALDGYARIVRETLDFVLREMTDPAGGFYSTQDADSEGEEGKFYVWTPQELEQVLGAERARTFGYVYDVSDASNFEGRSILNLPKTFDQCAKILSRDPAQLQAELADARAQLLAARDRRVHPGLDDKVLVSWNALMIDALAQAGTILAEPGYLAAATRAADFLLTTLKRPDGRLLHSWRQGQARFDAYLDDYACLANALVSLYEATFDERFLDHAVRLVDVVLADFIDSEQGGFFYTARDHEQLIARNKDVQDSSVPSGNAMAATVLVRLAKLTGQGDYLTAAENTLRAVAELLRRSPTSMGQMLLAWDMMVGPTPELVIVGGEDEVHDREVLSAIRRHYVPNKVVAFRARKQQSASGSPHLAPAFAGKHPLGADPTLYVCESFSCQAPISGVAAIVAQLESLASPKGDGA